MSLKCMKPQKVIFWMKGLSMKLFLWSLVFAITWTLLMGWLFTNYDEPIETYYEETK